MRVAGVISWLLVLSPRLYIEDIRLPAPFVVTCAPRAALACSVIPGHPMRSLPQRRWHTRSGLTRGALLQERLSDGQCEVLSPLGNREKPNRIELLEDRKSVV